MHLPASAENAFFLKRTKIMLNKLRIQLICILIIFLIKLNQIPTSPIVARFKSHKKTS